MSHTGHSSTTSKFSAVDPGTLEENGIDMNPVVFRESRNFQASLPRYCHDPEERILLCNIHSPGPRHVYLLWVCFQGFGYELKEAMQWARVLGVYRTPSLASHDALCWLLGKQRDAGAVQNAYTEVELRGTRHEDCFMYRTPHTLLFQVEGLFWTWTEEKPLL